MGGRHGYGTTFGELQKGLAIDLSNLNKVTVDKNAQTVTIGAAAKIKDVINPVADAGFQIGMSASSSSPTLLLPVDLATMEKEGFKMG